MEINQISQEMYGKDFVDLNPSEQDAVWAEYNRRWMRYGCDTDWC